ncbi:MFS transporter, partial [Xanthomonas citri pv. citri]|nr:MFS transporter [Xanthomonas citri pv. citri]
IRALVLSLLVLLLISIATTLLYDKRIKSAKETNKQASISS